jgi:hypothetical protein
LIRRYSTSRKRIIYFIFILIFLFLFSYFYFHIFILYIKKIDIQNTQYTYTSTTRQKYSTFYQPNHYERYKHYQTYPKGTY